MTTNFSNQYWMLSLAAAIEALLLVIKAVDKNDLVKIAPESRDDLGLAESNNSIAFTQPHS